MRIRFVGAVDRVTGSCCWLKDDRLGVQILVDCGLIQGEGNGNGWNQGKFPFDPKRITHVVLTHAHLDHCGLIPELYRQGYSGEVFCTKETAELAKITLRDAAKIGAVPFGVEVIEKVKFHEPTGKGLFTDFHPIGTDLFLHFCRSSHLLGAVSVEILWQPLGENGSGRRPQRRILFSGDLGVNREGFAPQPLLKATMREESEYAVVESTYARTQGPGSFRALRPHGFASLAGVSIRAGLEGREDGQEERPERRNLPPVEGPGGNPRGNGLLGSRRPGGHPGLDLSRTPGQAHGGGEDDLLEPRQ